MKRSGTIIMIREEARKGKSAYAIGKELGISKNTAKKYMTQDATQPAKAKRAGKLEIYKDQIHGMLEQGIFNCVVIMDRIKEAGYEGSISILKAYVHPYRPAKGIPAVRRYETLPGKQAQMDWGICQYVDLDGKAHKVPAFIMILSSSRAKYVEFAKRSDSASLLRCMLNAFEYFGGVPETVLTDNMKTVIVGRDNGTPIWNSAFENFAKDMGFTPKVCKVRRPQTKGKVERLVHYVKNNFLPGRGFENLDDLNRQAVDWCRKVDSKPHSTTGKIPLLELAHEKLLALPPEKIRSYYRFETRLVSREGLLSFDGVKYGVPWQYSGKEVRVHLYNGHIDIFLNETQIASHTAVPSSGRILFLPGQYTGLAEKNGIAVASFARKESPIVEVRSLELYDQLLGVSSNG